MFQYSFTGDVLKINNGGSATFVYGGVAPSFTTVRAYIVKEPGAGTVTLKVGGTNRGVMNAANASVTIGTIDYTQDFGVSDVEISVSGGSVHVLCVHAVTGKQGVDYYSSFNKGGLKLSWPMENAQGCGLLSLVLSELEIDFLSFEMDDEFGTTDQTILQTFFSILDANCRYADKLIFASTPRSANDSGKLESRKFILDECYSRDVSYIPFDCYRIMGSYSDMVAIFGSDDGTHPSAAAQLYSA
jgi:hypothetical protein